MNFREADRRYAELKRQHDSRALSTAEFEAQLKELMVLDEEGRWWAKSRKTGEWHYYDGKAWVQGTPPDLRLQPEHSERSPLTLTIPSDSSPTHDEQNGGKRHRRWSIWAALAGLVGMALVGMGLLIWFFVPTLFGSETLEVPSLEGQTLAAAQQSVGEDFELVSAEMESREPEGTIVSQQPQPGTKARQGTEISVVVSTGPVASTQPPPEETPADETPNDARSTVRYETISDDTGALQIEVPVEWNDVSGETWVFESEPVGPGILAAPDLEEWTTSDSAMGLLFGASSTLVPEYDENEVLNRFYSDFQDGCEYVGREPFQRGAFTGQKDVWENCGGVGTRLVQLVAMHEDQPYLVTVQIGLANGTDPEVEEHILNSFEVVGDI